MFFEEAVAGPGAEAIELLCLEIHRWGIRQDGLFVWSWWGWSQACVVGGLRASSSRGGRKVLERYTTRQRQPRSKQNPAQVKSDNEAVLDVEMRCGMVCSSARGRIKARPWVGGLVPGSAKNAKER